MAYTPVGKNKEEATAVEEGDKGTEKEVSSLLVRSGVMQSGLREKGP